MNPRRRAFVAFLLIAAAASLSAQQQSPTLRIGLWTLWRDQQITVSPQPQATVTLRSCPRCPSELIAQPATLRAAGSYVLLPSGQQAAAVWLAGPVTLAAHGERLTLANPVRIAARHDTLLLAVTLPIESYVERVVASESGSADTADSLRALAIVVRSYALHQAHGHADYDLCDSTHCQLLHWSGNPPRQAAAHAATLATSGQTLWFHGRPAAAWFNQNCGGRSATPAEVWPAANQKPLPWLASTPDPFCTAAGAHEWSAQISLGDLTTALANAGLVAPGWKNLTIARRGESGRAITLRFDSAEIPAEDARLAIGRSMGWGRILSTWFEVARRGDQFVFHGRGSGHGVGLCQAGAAAMAANGHSTAQILAQYFPGAIAADEQTGLPWQTLPGQGFVLETLDPADARHLPTLAQALEEAQSRSGLHAPQPLTVRAFRTVSGFRAATLAPGWVAAFAEGNWIGVQPLRTLDGRKLLLPVLRHEFLHALVESQATGRAPLWLREGLVEAWSASGVQPNRPTLPLDAIESNLAPSAGLAQSQAAHRAAAWYAARLLDRSGRAQVLAWLRSGVPQSALAPWR